ncbi:hypothetical protein LOK49_LG08G00282 [Camellia lanceoleosa]|uniref:Uncharacterized protein n=1 Tax=Camellia lanceoleosa TaxID=1840588 RepID=A0ACC0GTE6_9ERIC|nr:hypothetical protein LOK49_LG08G00282 [Camellia lanceoleosa]
MVYQQLCIANKAIHGSQTNENFEDPCGLIPHLSSSGSESGKVNQMDPIVDLDINITAKTFGMGSSQPSDPSKAPIYIKAKVAGMNSTQPLDRSIALTDDKKLLKRG